MKKLLLPAAVAAAMAYSGFAAAVDVHTTDTIIQGSQCVGVDCTTGESYGYDTVRLKENNLRIKFMDTSASGSFPTTDWQIIANDSTNGGSSYLSIYDNDAGKTVFRAYAGAPNNSVVIDSGGDLGLGTNTPATDIHAVNGNTPTLRLEQDGSSGFTAQIWDVAGNEVNFFVRDVTHSSKLPFRIFPGTANNDTLILDAAGEVGIHTTSPAETLHVYENVDPGTGTEVVALFHNAGGAVGIELRDGSQTGDTGKWYMRSRNTSFSLTQPGTGVTEMELDNSGNLTVTGNFISGSTTLNVPDYVFEPSYQLMPLPELAAFVQREKHLPNVPSARELKADGVNMSEMQMHLLEKVEELTLYTLELQGRLAALEGTQQTAAR